MFVCVCVLVCVSVCVCVCVCVSSFITAYVGNSKDDSHDLFSPSITWVLGIKSQVISFDSKHLSC